MRDMRKIGIVHMCRKLCTMNRKQNVIKGKRSQILVEKSARSETSL